MGYFFENTLTYVSQLGAQTHITLPL